MVLTWPRLLLKGVAMDNYQRVANVCYIHPKRVIR